MFDGPTRGFHKVLARDQTPHGADRNVSTSVFSRSLWALWIFAVVEPTVDKGLHVKIDSTGGIFQCSAQKRKIV